jgi:hypothetical protein
MAQIAEVQFRNPAHHAWRMKIEAGTGYTNSSEGMTWIHGKPEGKQKERQLAAVPNDVFVRVTFEEAK